MKRRSRIHFLRCLALTLLLSGLVPVTAIAGSPGVKPLQPMAWNLFSPAQDQEIGRELNAWVEERAPVVEEGKVTAYLEKVLDRLMPGQEAEGPAASLLTYSEPYAFTSPDGRVFLTTGLFRAMEDEAQLAGLLAHCLAHAELRHATRHISTAARFKSRAVIYMAERSERTLFDVLGDAYVQPVPGAPVMEHDLEDEQEAIARATQLLNDAGYPPSAALDWRASLEASDPDDAERFLARHPMPADTAVPADTTATRRPIAGSWRFSRLQRRLSAPGNSDDLDGLLAWSPPPSTPGLSRTHEIFITGSYQFRYPSDWRQGMPDHDERIEVAPKGGRTAVPGGTSDIEVGVIAGTFPAEAGEKPPTRLFLDQLQALRPGLRPVTDEPFPVVRERTPSRTLDGVVLSGPSPSGQGNERVWAVTTRLDGRLFYLMAIAPTDRFAYYRDEFEAIVQSIEFEGHPIPVEGMPAAQAAETLDRSDHPMGES